MGTLVGLGSVEGVSVFNLWSFVCHVMEDLCK